MEGSSDPVRSGNIGRPAPARHHVEVAQLSTRSSWGFGWRILRAPGRTEEKGGVCCVLPGINWFAIKLSSNICRWSFSHIKSWKVLLGQEYSAGVKLNGSISSVFHQEHEWNFHVYKNVNFLEKSGHTAHVLKSRPRALDSIFLLRGITSWRPSAASAGNWWLEQRRSSTSSSVLPMVSWYAPCLSVWLSF